MSVKVMFLGRLGNNLFQYALGRIIADRLGLELSCGRLVAPGSSSNPGGLDIHGRGDLTGNQSAFPHAPLHRPGIAVTEPGRDLVFRPGGDWDGQGLDLAAILSDRTPRRIRLAGFFQRFDYYAPCQDHIGDWFTLAPDPAVPTVGRDDILIDIRGGEDFERLGWRIDPAYYHQTLARMQNRGQVYLTGVGLTESLRSEFAPYGAKVFHSTPIANLRFMRQFRRMVLANSTFSWWAGFLSDAEEIYAPVNPDEAAFSFRNAAGVDLNMRAERYREVRVGFLSSV